MYENVPYLTILYDKVKDKTILCLINLLSKNYISYYEINAIHHDDMIKFFQMTENWWIKCPLFPVSLYYKDEFKPFNYSKKYMFNGNYQIIGGFTGVNLKSLSEKRIKRKIIHID